MHRNLLAVLAENQGLREILFLLCEVWPCECTVKINAILTYTEKGHRSGTTETQRFGQRPLEKIRQNHPRKP
jgi:hypothetical protein